MNLLKPLVLASRSPRREVLLRQIGIQPIVASCDIPELFELTETPQTNAIRLAQEKASCVAERFDNAYIVGADTIVEVNGDILGKPADPDDATRMLRMLSGRTHTVHTAFALLDRPGAEVRTGVESTLVTFRTLPDHEIREYVAAGSPLDKAGAYGIQDDYGAVFVTRIEGCYYTVVGLPLARFYSALVEVQSKGQAGHG